MLITDSMILMIAMSIYCNCQDLAELKYGQPHKAANILKPIFREVTSVIAHK